MSKDHESAPENRNGSDATEAQNELHQAETEALVKAEASSAEASEAEEKSRPSDDDDIEPDPWRARYEAMPIEKQNKAQVLIGLAMSAAVGILLFLFNSETKQEGILPSWNWILALGIAMIAPRIFENKLGASLPLMRKALLYGVIGVVALLVLYAALTGKF